MTFKNYVAKSIPEIESVLLNTYRNESIPQNCFYIFNFAQQFSKHTASPDTFCVFIYVCVFETMASLNVITESITVAMPYVTKDPTNTLQTSTRTQCINFRSLCLLFDTSLYIYFVLICFDEIINLF